MRISHGMKVDFCSARLSGVRSSVIMAARAAVDGQEATGFRSAFAALPPPRTSSGCRSRRQCPQRQSRPTATTHPRLLFPSSLIRFCDDSTSGAAGRIELTGRAPRAHHAQEPQHPGAV